MSTADLDAFRAINPDDFYQRFLSGGIRPDGRSLLTCRRTSATLGAIAGVDGSCSVKIGNTTALCAIQAEITTPSIDAPDRGFVNVSVNLSPLCSTSFALGKPGQLSLSVAGVVSRLLRRGSMLDLGQLCIRTGRHVWILYVDVVCLNYDGNALDTVLLAVQGAVLDLRLPIPIVPVDDDEGTDSGKLRVQTGEFQRMTSGTRTFSLTFALIDGRLIADPNAEEERLHGGGARLLSVICNEYGEIVSVHKPGGVQVHENTLRSAIEAGLSRAKALDRVLTKAISRGRQSSSPQ